MTNMILGHAVGSVVAGHRRVDPYAAGGFTPRYVADFRRGKFRSPAGAKRPDAMTISRAGLGTMIDRDGKLKWGPHNLIHRSSNFNAWTDDLIGGHLTADYAIAPDETQTAYRWKPPFAADPGSSAVTSRIHINPGQMTAGERYRIGICEKPIQTKSLYVGNPDGGDTEYDPRAWVTRTPVPLVTR